jgi:hypothetical protein
MVNAVYAVSAQELFRAEMGVEEFAFQRSEVETQFGLPQDDYPFFFRMLGKRFRHPNQCFFQIC